MPSSLTAQRNPPRPGSMVACCIYAPAGKVVDSVVTLSCGAMLWCQETDSEWAEKLRQLEDELGLPVEIAAWPTGDNPAAYKPGHWMRHDTPQRKLMRG